MHLLDLEPCSFLIHAPALVNAGVTEITLSRSITLHTIGEQTDRHVTQMFVQGVRGPNNLYHVGPAPAVACDPANSVAQVLAMLVPGVTIRERLPDGSIRTLVDVMAVPQAPTQAELDRVVRETTEVQDLRPELPPAFESTEAEMRALGLLDAEAEPEDVSGYIEEGVSVEVNMGAGPPKERYIDDPNF